MRLVWLALALLFFAPFAAAGPGLDPIEALPNAAQEARARALFKELRCVVCQSESLDDSEADLARDMRRLVRGQIAAGRNDAEVRSYLVARYGEFVLLSPPSKPSTWALWFGPFVLFGIILSAILWFLLHRRSAPEQPLSSEELSQLADSGENLHKT